MNSIDVVIPVFNQPLPLELTLEGFCRQTLPLDRVAITVVDDGSTDPIRPLVERFDRMLPIRYLRLPRKGRSAARNAGSRCGQADLLIYCDADRIPRRRFLEAHLRAARQGRERMVVGQVREMYVTDLERRAQQARQQAMREKHDRIPQYCRLIYRLFDPEGNTASPVAWLAALSGNLSLPRSWYERIGGFDEGFEDWGFEHFEFGFRGAMQGLPFHYCAEAVNVHLAHARAIDSYRAQLRRSHAYFYRKHDHPAVGKLLDFMLGEVSLAQFEACAAGETAAGRLAAKDTAACDGRDGGSPARGGAAGEDDADDGYVRIQNF